MKRVGLVLTSLCVVSFLTGCGGKEKKLECVLESNNMKQVYTMNFDKKDNFSSAILVQDVTLDENSLKATSLDDYKTQINKAWEATEMGSLNHKVTDNGKDTITLTVDFDKKDVKKLAGSDKANIDDLKETLEKSNYTCKVK